MQISNVTINETTKVVEVTASPAVVGVQGKDAYQVWLEDNPGGTKEDWKKYLTPKISFKLENKHLIITIE